VLSVCLFMAIALSVERPWGFLSSDRGNRHKNECSLSPPPTNIPLPRLSWWLFPFLSGNRKARSPQISPVRGGSEACSFSFSHQMPLIFFIEIHAYFYKLFGQGVTLNYCNIINYVTNNTHTKPKLHLTTPLLTSTFSWNSGEAPSQVAPLLSIPGVSCKQMESATDV
jgi:hypothetical protein